MNMLISPTILWFALGMLAFACAGVNLMLGSFGKKKQWLVLLFASMSLACLSLLAGYFVVWERVAASDWSALMDIIPSMCKLTGGAVLVGIALNVAVLIQNLRKK